MSTTILHNELHSAFNLRLYYSVTIDRLPIIMLNLQFSQGANLGSSNSLNKHQRTKSSPEQLGTTTISPSEASRRLIASESMNDLSPPRHVRHSDIDTDEIPHITPPGTPPPPYPVASPGNDTSNSTINDVSLPPKSDLSNRVR